MAIIAAIMGALVYIAVSILIGAIVLRIAAKWVLKEDVAFSKAFGTVLIAYPIHTTIACVWDSSLAWQRTQWRQRMRSCS